MQPGRRMDVAVDLVKQDGDTATFKGKGADDAGRQTVAAQFVLPATAWPAAARPGPAPTSSC